MINVPRTDSKGNLTNLVRSPGSSGAKGTKGRVEIFLTHDDETGEDTLVFVDVGGYGRDRWRAEVVVSQENLEQMALAIASFAARDVADTRVPLQNVETEEAAEDNDTEAEPVEDVVQTTSETQVQTQVQ